MAVEFIVVRKPQAPDPVRALFEVSFAEADGADEPAFPAWLEADWKSSRPPRGKSNRALRLEIGWE